MTNPGATLTALADLQWLRRLAVLLARDDDDAADLVQDTLVTAWTDPPADREQPLRPWLATVLRNRFRMGLRSQGRRERRELAGEAVATSAALPDRELARLELLRVLLAELEQLPAEDRKIVMRRFFEGESAAEIARALGIPAATVRSRLHRSLQRLRGRMDERHGDRSAWSAVILAPVGAAPPPAQVAPGGEVMSIVVKIGLVMTVGVAGGLALVGGGEPRVEQAAPRTVEAAAAAPAPAADWQRRREDIRQRLPPTIAAPKVEPAGPEEHAPFRELVRECLTDLDSQANGALTIDVTKIGAPDVGTIYDSVELVETTLADEDVLECVVQSFHGWVGDPPEEGFERKSRITMVVGEPETQELKDRRRFEFIVGAHFGEVQFCAHKTEAPPGVLVMSWTLHHQDGTGQVHVQETDLPRATVDCLVRAGQRWKFPAEWSGSGRTYEYRFAVRSDMQPPAAGGADDE